MLTTILFFGLILLCFWPLGYLLALSVSRQRRPAKEQEAFVVKSVAVAVGAFVVLSSIYGAVACVLILFGQFFLGFLLVLFRHFGDD